MKKLIALCAIMALLAYSPVAMAQAIPDKDTTEIAETSPVGKAFADGEILNLADAFEKKFQYVLNDFCL